MKRTRVCFHSNCTGGNGTFKVLTAEDYFHMEEHNKKEIEEGKREGGREKEVEGRERGKEMKGRGLGEGDDVWKDTGSMRIPPFTVYPVLFSLNKGEFMDLSIEFVPLNVGDHICEFYLLCDNCQSRRFTISASAREIQISIVEINNVEYNGKITDLASDLYFSPVTVETEKVQQIVLVNDTGIPIEYEWVWVPSTVQRTYALEAAKDIVR